jgi:hypothetical protein
VVREEEPFEMVEGLFELVVVVRVQDEKESALRMVYSGYWNVRSRMLVELVVVVVRDDVVHLLCQTLNLHHLHDVFVVAEAVLTSCQ